jgi:hypothetical protein
MDRPRASRNGRLVEPTPASHQAAISFLLQAHREAERRKLPDWEFAVELEALERLGVTVNALRSLIADGYIEHRIEVTGRKSKRRVFRRVGHSGFSGRSCFVLTAKGLARGGRMTGKRGSASPVRAPMVLNGQGELLPVPVWDAKNRILLYDGRAVKRFKRPAPNQEVILKQFQRMKWKQRVPNPLPRVERMNRKVRLRDTVKHLNRRHEVKAMRFHSTDCGHFVTWGRT